MMEQLIQTLQQIRSFQTSIQNNNLLVKVMNLDFILFTPPKVKYSFTDFWGEVIFIPKFKKISKSQSDANSSFFGTFFNCYNSIKTTEAHLTVDNALMDVKGFYAQIQQPAAQEMTESSKDQDQIDKHIPCLFLDSMVKSEYLLIYFHASGEDIKLCHGLLNHLRNSYQINVLAMEYPGYSIHKGKPKSDKIKQEAKIVYDFVKEKLGFMQDKIILMGRSIGTGIVLELMENVQPKALVLISPFSNIKTLAKQFAGKVGHIIAKQTYDNSSNIKNVKCPLFILHGKNDELISYQNSVELAKICNGEVRTNFPSKMTHSQFDYYTDLSDPLREFLMENGVQLYKQGMNGPQLSDNLFKCPDNIKF